MPRAKSKTPPPADFTAEPVSEAPAAPPLSDEPPILTRLEAPSRWNWALVAGGVVLAAGLSVFAVRGAMKRGGKGER